MNRDPSHVRLTFHHTRRAIRIVLSSKTDGSAVESIKQCPGQRTLPEGSGVGGAKWGCRQETDCLLSSKKGSLTKQQGDVQFLASIGLDSVTVRTVTAGARWH